MKVYEITYPTNPNDTPEDRISVRCFGSKAEATRAFNAFKKELDSQHPGWWPWVGELQLDVVTLADLPRKKLAVACLDRNGYAASRQRIKTARGK